MAAEFQSPDPLAQAANVVQQMSGLSAEEWLMAAFAVGVLVYFLMGKSRGIDRRGTRR
ncbi:MAG: hypothetical protein AAGE18_02845 [Pseudomonadota bacterium]